MDFEKLALFKTTHARRSRRLGLCHLATGARCCGRLTDGTSEITTYGIVRMTYGVICGGANGRELSHRVVLAAAGGANNSMERKSLPLVATPLCSALCTKNAMNCIFRCQGSAHLAPVSWRNHSDKQISDDNYRSDDCSRRI